MPGTFWRARQIETIKMSEKEISIFDYVNSINNKEYIFNEETYNKKAYSQFVINMAFSYYPDTVFLVNEINKYSNVTDRQHYDFLYHTVRKYKRYSKWNKKSNEDDAKAVSEFYGISIREAKEMMSILPESEMERIHKRKGD
jgi:hypothetical protein